MTFGSTVPPLRQATVHLQPIVMMHLLLLFVLIQFEKLPLGWLLVDSVPVVGASFAWPFLDWLHLGPRLLVPERLHQIIIEIDVDARILLPAPKPLMRAPEEIEMNARQLAPVIYASSVGIIFGNLLKDLFMNAHRFGVGADGSVEFRTKSVNLQGSTIEQAPDAAYIVADVFE